MNIDLIVHLCEAVPTPEPQPDADAAQMPPPLLAKWEREIVPPCCSSSNDPALLLTSLINESDYETGAASLAEELARRQEKLADRTEYKRFHHRSSRVKRCVQDLCVASQWKVGVYIVTPKEVVYTHGNLPYDEFFTWALHYGHRSNINLSKDTETQQLEALRMKYGIKRIVTWHLELLISQMDALIDVCNVRIAILIACDDQPLTISAGNLPASKINHVFKSAVEDPESGHPRSHAADHVRYSFATASFGNSFSICSTKAEAKGE
jgi:hypothetical protein